VVENRFEKAIILEDGTHFSEDFARIARGKLATDIAFEVLKLEGINVKNKTFMQKRGMPVNIMAIADTHGAAAYLVTLAGARRIVKCLSQMRYRFDDDLFCNWRNGLVIYDYYPYPVWQGEQPSTIGDRTGRDRSAGERRKLHLLRILPKFYDKVNRTLFYLRRFGLSGLRPKNLAAFPPEAARRR